MEQGFLKITDEKLMEERAKKGFCTSDVRQMNGWLISIIPAMLRELLRQLNKDAAFDVEECVKSSDERIPSLIRILDLACEDCDVVKSRLGFSLLGEEIDKLCISDGEAGWKEQLSDNLGACWLKQDDKLMIEERAEKGFCEADVRHMDRWLVTVIPAMLNEMLEELFKDFPDADDKIKNDEGTISEVLRAFEKAGKTGNCQDVRLALMLLGGYMDNLWL